MRAAWPFRASAGEELAGSGRQRRLPVEVARAIAYVLGNFGVRAGRWAARALGRESSEGAKRSATAGPDPYGSSGPDGPPLTADPGRGSSAKASAEVCAAPRQPTGGCGRARGQLQEQALEDDGVVLLDDALVPGGDQQTQVESTERGEGVAPLARRHAEAAIEAGHERAVQEVVCGLMAPDAVEAQLLGKAPL